MKIKIEKTSIAHAACCVGLNTYGEGGNTCTHENQPSPCRLGSYAVGERGAYLGQGDGIKDGESKSLAGATPFTREDYSLIEQTLQLPKITRFLLTRGAIPDLRGHFRVCQVSGDNERPVFGS